jgi:transposase
MTALVEELVPDDLWALVEPLLPPPPRPWWGRPVRAIPGRSCFAAIVYMGRTSPSWRLLPARELGYGSSATVSSLPASSRVTWKGRGGHTASEQPAGGMVAGKPAWWKLLAVAA